MCIVADNTTHTNASSIGLSIVTVIVGVVVVGAVVFIAAVVTCCVVNMANRRYAKNLKLKENYYYGPQRGSSNTPLQRAIKVKFYYTM